MARWPLATWVAVGCLLAVTLVGLGTVSHGRNELFQMPPPVVDAPYHRRALQERPMGNAIVRRRAGTGVSYKQQQLSMWDLPTLTGLKSPHSEGNFGRSYSRYGLETPPMYERRYPLYHKSPCISGCDLDEENSLWRAHDLLAHAALTHQQRIQAIKAQEEKTKIWANAMRAHLDSISGVTTGVCMPTTECSSPDDCKAAMTQHDCIARLGTWMPHDVDEVTKHADAYAADMMNNIKNEVKMMQDANEAGVSSEEKPDLDLVDKPI